MSERLLSCCPISGEGQHFLRCNWPRLPTLGPFVFGEPKSVTARIRQTKVSRPPPKQDRKTQGRSGLAMPLRFVRLDSTPLYLQARGFCFFILRIRASQQSNSLAYSWLRQ